MKKINCLIADDEPLARSVLENYVSQIERLNLLAICKDGAQVANVLLNHPVNLIFLDINMPRLSGMELLRTVPDMPPVILTTAYSEYALESYRFKVVDYLLKPVSFEAFIRAVQKFSQQFVERQELPIMQPTGRPFLYVRSDKKMIRIYYDEILYIEGLKDYVQLHLKGRKVITHQTLTSLEEKLPGTLFMRIHRSFIVSLPEIAAFTARSVEVGGREIPVGESYQRPFNTMLQSWTDQ